MAKKADLQEQEIKFMKAMENAVNAGQEKLVEDSIDLFGKLVASELRKMSEHEQCLAKNQIQNVIFNIQMNSVSQGNHANWQGASNNYHHGMYGPNLQAFTAPLAGINLPKPLTSLRGSYSEQLGNC